MLEIILTILFCWIFIKALGLLFRLTWGVTKIVASLLLSLAVPMLVACLVFAGGLLILIPLGLIGLAFGLLRACI